MDTLLPLLVIDFLGKPAWVWLVFFGVVVTLLAFDLGVCCTRMIMKSACAKAYCSLRATSASR